MNLYSATTRQFLRESIGETEPVFGSHPIKAYRNIGRYHHFFPHFLDERNKKLTRERSHFARYADDFIILVKSKAIGNKVKVAIPHFISKPFKLIVNEKNLKRKYGY